jgi:hypothetical protein
MNINSKIYSLSRSINQERNYVRYLFLSEGNEAIIKIVDYQYVQEFENQCIYNLAFGNYDVENDKVVDDENSNNGDVYAVFNTVLSTIPNFFQLSSNDKIIIQGSDSTLEFFQKCKKNCSKNWCKGKCRKFNQRLRIYRSYIDKNYNELVKEYNFYGGYIEDFGNTYLENYTKDKAYINVVVEKK